MKPCHAITLLSVGCAILIARPAQSTRAADEPIGPNVESAIDRGLASLAKEQNASGAWHEGMANHSTAITALAAMAFMSRGHVPGQGRYGDNVNRAIDYVLSHQAANGLITDTDSQPMYDHGICTIMLCEAYGMLDDQRQQRTRAVVNRAVGLILRAQRISKDSDFQGGWRYQANATDSDLSVTGWQLLALRAAGNIGAAVPGSYLEDGINYVLNRATSNGGFAYQGGSGVDAALTGTGVLALALLNKDGDPRLAAKIAAGGDYLIRTDLGPRSQNYYYYTMYYVAQAAWQLGGEAGDTLTHRVRDSLLSRQLAGGSWPVEGRENVGGSDYSTSLAILALSVPYRYLPIYQR